ncbi:hypothetical protein ACPWT1_07765 [Ramlibacter sp. MMS24-I3-19]|uniref:hypothetical protein n=1 Tax=Ramlibacter sp. MMS24-I3-19 TaxID=3416606 RepID=UPI003D0198EA
MAKLVFARHASGEVRHVSDVRSGLAYGCMCLDCGERLIARKGEVREHHFAHTSGNEHDWAWETHLHLYAKQLVAQAGGLAVPLHASICEHLGFPESRQRGRLDAHPLGIEQEVARGAVRPDLIVQVADRRIEVALEVYVTHAADRAKRQEFKRLRLPALEIDLSRMQRYGFNVDRVRAAVIDEVDNKRWLWPLPPAPVRASAGLSDEEYAPPQELAPQAEEPSGPLPPLPGPATYGFKVAGWSAIVRVTVEPQDGVIRIDVPDLPLGRLASTPIEYAAPRVADSVAETIRCLAPNARQEHRGLWFVPQRYADKVAAALQAAAEKYETTQADRRLAQKAQMFPAAPTPYQPSRRSEPAAPPPYDNPYARRRG